MAKGRPLQPLAVSRDTREELASMARSRSLPAGLVSRARIVLLCAEGLDNSAVAARLRVSRQTVGRWRERFRTQSLMGLYDEHRPGRPRSIPDDTVMTLLQKTLETRPPDGSTHWTCRSMAAATGVSKSTVQRLWTAFHLQPHRQKHFPLSTSPGQGVVGAWIAGVVDLVGATEQPFGVSLPIRYCLHKNLRHCPAIQRPHPTNRMTLEERDWRDSYLPDTTPPKSSFCGSWELLRRGHCLGVLHAKPLLLGRERGTGWIGLASADHWDHADRASPNDDCKASPVRISLTSDRTES